MELAASNNNLHFVEEDIDGCVNQNGNLKNDSDRFGLLMYQAFDIMVNGTLSNINYVEV